MPSPTRASPSPSYQIFMLALCLYTLGALAVQATARLEPEVRGVLDYADHAVCVVFLADFVFNLWRAPERWRYFRTWGWLDLLSSIPMLDAARWGRAARVARVLRVLRGLRATRLLASAVLERRVENTFLAASLVALLLVVFGSVAVLQFETDAGANIRTAEDAVWWAVTTITTVGYGDRYPVTSEGRFVAAVLMAAGVGLFGVFSGFLAAWLLGQESGAPSELSALREEVAALREVIQAQAARHAPRPDAGDGEPAGEI